jgi:hypothetical protein
MAEYMPGWRENLPVTAKVIGLWQRYQWLRHLARPEEVSVEPPPIRSHGDIAHVAHRRSAGIAVEHALAAVDAGHSPNPALTTTSWACLASIVVPLQDQRMSLDA